MKFFSNDAKETTEDQAHDDRDLATPGSVEAVPQQRAGSPWSDAPGSDADLARDDYSRDEVRPDDTVADGAPRVESESETDTGSRTDFRNDDLRNDDLQSDELRNDELRNDDLQNDELRRDDDSEVRTDGDEPVRSDADPVAHTEAVDLPLDDDDETRDRTDRADQGFGDRPETDLGTVENRDDVDERDAADRTVVDTADAQTYGPDGTVTPATVDSDNDFDRTPDDLDRTQVDEPVVAQADTDRVTSEEDHEVTDTSADFEPAVAADTTAADADADADVVPVPVDTTADKTPGSVEEPKIDRLFTDGDSFAERFREIQLRFVDSPKDATAEAATLVGEAVDRLTSALKSQQESLSSSSDDTERLRVELRGYRDMLNRLTAL